MLHYIKSSQSDKVVKYGSDCMHDEEDRADPSYYVLSFLDEEPTMSCSLRIAICHHTKLFEQQRSG